MDTIYPIVLAIMFFLAGPSLLQIAYALFKTRMDGFIENLVMMIVGLLVVVAAIACVVFSVVVIGIVAMR